MIIKIDRLKDPLSEDNGIWFVMINGRIVFKDVYKSVCIKYARLMEMEEN